MIHPTAKVYEKVNKSVLKEHDFTSLNPLHRPYLFKLAAMLLSFVTVFQKLPEQWCNSKLAVRVTVIL